MLASVTHITHFMAMSISLWMAFYLFARGFPSRITLRAVLALLAIAVFFLDTYNHFQIPQTTTNTLRAALLVIGLNCWYSVTYALLPHETQTRYHWMEISVYLLGAASVILLITSDEGAVRDVNTLYTARLKGTFSDILYGATQIIATIGVIFNLSIQERTRRALEGKYYFAASMFLALALVYGILSLTAKAPFPRVIEDGLVFGGIFLLGVSVARHQSLIERRTIWQDFPIAMLGMISIVTFYMVVCFWIGISENLLGTVAALVIVSHSMYDLGREAVERWRRLEEDRFRRKPKIAGVETLASHLDEQLALLLQTLNSASGVIAVRQAGKLVVSASRNSLPLDSETPDLPASGESIFRTKNRMPGIVWASLAYEGMESIALVGIGPSTTKLEYSSGDLELLEEFTDQVGTLISISKTYNNEIQPAINRVTESLTPTLEADWVKLVDEGLRRFADYVSLGRSPLADRVSANGESHIERGKHVQNILREAIQSLRPEGERPPEPLPREWYNHVVLHDAYIKGVPNREVMARLYVSEGTFHRIRRHAVRGVARYLIEKRNWDNNSF